MRPLLYKMKVGLGVGVLMPLLASIERVMYGKR